MTYLDPASKPESKPQRLKIVKVPLQIKLQIFETVFGISCRFLEKKLYLNDNLFSSATVPTLIQQD